MYCVAVLAVDLMIIGAKGDPESNALMQLVLMYILLFFGIPFVAIIFVLFIVFGALTPTPSRSEAAPTSDHGEYWG